MARLREVLGIIKSYDVDALICGHGPSLDMSCVHRFEAYFEMMVEKVSPLVGQGMTNEEIEKQVLPPADMEHWWRFAAWKHAKNIELLAEHYQI